MARNSGGTAQAFAILTGLALLTVPIAASEPSAQQDGTHPAAETATHPHDQSAAMRGEGDQDGDSDEDPRDSDDDDGEQRPSQKAGHATIENNTSVEGRFVSFGITPDNGTLTDFRIHGAPWFDVIQAPGGFEARTAGSSIWLTGQDFEIHVADNPVGLIRFASSNASALAFTPSDDAERDNRAGYDGITVDDRGGYFVGAAGHDPILLGDGGFFKLRSASVPDVSSLVHSQQDVIELAIAQGYVGAQIQVLEDGMDLLAYRSIDADVQSLRNGSLRFIFNSADQAGAAVLADIDSGHFGADRVNVRYLREHLGVLAPAAISEANGLKDVLRADDDEGVEYWWFSDPGGLHVMVSFPSFSIQAFEVEGLRADDNPSILYGAAIGGLVVLVASAGLLGNRGPTKTRHRRHRRYRRAPQSP